MLRRRVDEIERCPVPPGREQAIQAVVRRLREAVGQLDRLVVALRSHARADPGWDAVRTLAEEAVASCRSADELIAAASRMLDDPEGDRVPHGDDDEDPA